MAEGIMLLAYVRPDYIFFEWKGRAGREVIKVVLKKIRQCGHMGGFTKYFFLRYFFHLDECQGGECQAGGGGQCQFYFYFVRGGGQVGGVKRNY